MVSHKLLLVFLLENLKQAKSEQFVVTIEHSRILYSDENSLNMSNFLFFMDSVTSKLGMFKKLSRLPGISSFVVKNNKIDDKLCE